MASPSTHNVRLLRESPPLQPLPGRVEDHFQVDHADSYARRARVRRPGVEARTAWRRTGVRGPSGGIAPASFPQAQRFLQRRGGTIDLLAARMHWQHSSSDDAVNGESEAALGGGQASDIAGRPVDASFFQLKAVRILPAPPKLSSQASRLQAPSDATQRASIGSAFSFDEEEEAGDEGQSGSVDQEDNDYFLNRLVGESFTVGPSGATIGRGKECDIRLPKPSGAGLEHVKISWSRNETGRTFAATDSPADPGSGERSKTKLTFADLTGGGCFQLSSVAGVTLDVPRPAEEDYLAPQQEPGPGMGISEDDQLVARNAVMLNSSDLFWQMKFTVGRVQFCILPLSPASLVSSTLFAAVRNDDLNTLVAITEAAKVPGGLKGTGEACPLLRQTSVQTARRLNLEIHELQRKPNIHAAEEEETNSDAEQQLSPFHALQGRANVGGRRNRSMPAQNVIRQYLRQYNELETSTFVPLLQVAVETGNPDVVHFLLEEGADVNRVFEDTYLTPLQMAVTKDNVPVVRMLLKSGANAEGASELGQMPFQMATSHVMRRLLLQTALLCSSSEAGDTAEVLHLLDSGMPANALGLGRKSALHFACLGGHCEIVKMLLNAGANPNQKGGSRLRTPLHYAAVSGNVDVAQCLLDAGAREQTQDALGYVPLNLTDKADMCRLLNTEAPSLCLAAQGGDVSEARRLLENKELGEEERLDLVNQRNEQHHAAVHLACVAGNMELIQLLLQHSADVELPGGSDEWTPLMFAAMAGQASVVEYLLAVGADQALCSAAGSTVQDLVEDALKNIKVEEEAARELTLGPPRRPTTVAPRAETLAPPPLISRQTSNQTSEEQKQWLQQRRARLEAVLSVLRSGPQRMQLALNHNDLDTARSLLENGVTTANCIFEQPLQGTALYHACAVGRGEFASLLLDHGANLRTAGEDGLMPAHMAASQGHCAVLELLFSHGQSVNERESQGGNTLLHVASICNRPSVVELLLQRGADRTLLNNDAQSAFNIAKQANVQRLLAAGAQRLLVESRAGSVTRVRSLLEDEGGVTRQELEEISSTGASGPGPLHEAVRRNHLAVVEVLLQYKCDVNATVGERHETSLHIAAHRGLTDLAKYLLDHGARVEIKNWLGQTPFEVARHNAMRKLLVQPQRVIKVQAVPDLNDDIPDDKRCRVCMDKQINTIILPCGHQAFCSDCAARLTECALDRQPINEIVKVFCA